MNRQPAQKPRLSKGARRDAHLLLRALRTARHHLRMLGTSPGLNEAQRTNESWIRRYLNGAEAELAGLSLGGRPTPSQSGETR